MQELAMWGSWAVAAAYGAWVAWREVWPVASRLVRQQAAAEAFGGGGAPREAGWHGPLVRAWGWLAVWVVLCTAWSALLVWSGAMIWSGSPLTRSLFG